MINNDQRRRIEAVIQDRMTSPHTWGGNDCGMFVGDCLLAATGIDYAEPLRCAYFSEEGLTDALDRMGCRSVEDFVQWQADAHHWQRVDEWERSEWGDVAVYNGPAHIGLGIAVGAYVVTPGEKRMARILRSTCNYFWRVPWDS